MTHSIITRGITAATLVCTAIALSACGGGYYRDRASVRIEVTDHNARGEHRDQDHDGVPNRVDRDRDGDGVPNRVDDAPRNPTRN